MALLEQHPATVAALVFDDEEESEEDDDSAAESVYRSSGEEYLLVSYSLPRPKHMLLNTGQGKPWHCLNNIR